MARAARACARAPTQQRFAPAARAPAPGALQHTRARANRSAAARGHELRKAGRHGRMLTWKARAVPPALRCWMRWPENKVGGPNTTFKRPSDYHQVVGRHPLCDACPCGRARPSSQSSTCCTTSARNAWPALSSCPLCSLADAKHRVPGVKEAGCGTKPPHIAPRVEAADGGCRRQRPATGSSGATTQLCRRASSPT